MSRFRAAVLTPALALGVGLAPMLTGALAGAAVTGSDSGGDPYFPLDGNGGYEVVHYRIADDYRPGSRPAHRHHRHPAPAPPQDLRAFHLDLALTADRVRVNGTAASLLQARPPRAARRARAHRSPPARPSGWWSPTTAVPARSSPPASRRSPTPASAGRGRRGGPAADGAVVVRRQRDPGGQGDLRHRAPGAARPGGAQQRRAGLPRARRRLDPLDVADDRADDDVPRLLRRRAVPHRDRPRRRPAVPLRRLGAARRHRPRRGAGDAAPRRPRWCRGWRATFGPYPFTSSGGVVVGAPLAYLLETQSRPVYPYIGGRTPSNVSLVVHEQAHQWFGDDVAVRPVARHLAQRGLRDVRRVGVGRAPGDAVASTARLQREYDGHPASATAFWNLQISDPGADRMFSTTDLRPRRHDPGRAAPPGRRRHASRHRADLGQAQRRRARHRRTSSGRWPSELSGQDLDGFFTEWLDDTDNPPAPRRTDWHERLPDPHLRRHARAQHRGPRGLLGRAGRAASTGSPSRRGSSTTAARRSTAGSPTPRSTPATTRSTGTSSTGRGDQAALIYDSPVTGTRATLHLRRAAGAGRRVRRRAARRSASRRATGSSSTCRWSPRPSSRCWPAPGSARCTRWCSAGSPPSELAARIDDAQPEGRRRRVAAASSRPASSSTSRCSTRRSSWPTHQPDGRASSSSDRRPRPRWSRAATSTGTSATGRPAATRPGRLRRGRRDRPALRPLHLRHDRQAQGHRPRQRRPRGRAGAGRCRNIYDIDAGRGVVDRLRRRLGRRPLLHRLRAAAHRRDDGALRGQAGRHPGRRRVLAGDRRARGRGAVHRADRDPGDQEGGPRRRSCSPTTTSRRCGRCSSPASGSTPTPTTWATERLGVPVVDNWWQTETGWPIAANLRGLEPMPIKPGSPTVPVPGYDVQVLDDDGHAGRRPARRARSASSCRCRPGTLPTLWGDDERYVDVVPVGLRRLLPDRRRRLRRRGRLPLRHGPHRRRHQRRRAPALDRLDRGGARRPPGGRRVRRDRGGRRRSRARCRAASSCSRPASTRRPGRASRARAGRSGCATRSAPSPRFKRRRRRRRRCRRPGRARSCARRCARSPTARTPSRRRPSRTPPCSTPSAPPSAPTAPPLLTRARLVPDPRRGARVRARGARTREAALVCATSMCGREGQLCGGAGGGRRRD